MDAAASKTTAYVTAQKNLEILLASSLLSAILRVSKRETWKPDDTTPHRGKEGAGLP